MFKIESYISPIILSRVEKYVKNIKPKDSQLSLWEGDVALQNLDLRLDVLEEELQLPFTFLSGHIHELIIHVPWTKIASEPITITINTIEFILKLKNADEIGGRKRNKRRKTAKQDDVVAPPGYMASLINKITNNISIKCNNIIFKYIEDDIVVSMNIQMLCIDSADSEWNPAFIDISPINVLLRKVANISDLTICLDKRNTMGKIDVCQEPLVYRCSLQLRLLRSYKLSSAHQTSVMHVDVHTKSIELNISALQFPMVMRLMNLILNLKAKRLKSSSQISSSVNDDTPTDESDYDGDESFVGWVWNSLPTIFPNQQLHEFGSEVNGHTVEMGIYVDSIKVTIKAQDTLVDSIVNSSQKIRYTPFLKIVFEGSYMNIQSLGYRWSNTKFGISRLEVRPCGNCPCGNSQDVPYFLQSSTSAEGTNFLEDSLHDKNSAENKGLARTYNTSWNQHFELVTEGWLVHKTPALAVDMVSRIEFTDDQTGSEFESDFELSNLPEQYLCRMFVGPLRVKYNASMDHQIDILRQYCSLYDYPPYALVKLPVSRAKLQPPSTEDYEALISNIPFRRYDLILRKCTVELFMRDHISMSERERKIYPTKVTNWWLIPFAEIECATLSGQITQPAYPSRVVHTTCQLPEPDARLLDNCFTRCYAEANGVSVRLVAQDNRHQIAFVNRCVANYRRLIMPELWMNNRIAQSSVHVTVDKVIVSLNRPQQMAAYLLALGLTSVTGCPDLYGLPFYVASLQNAKLPVIEVCWQKINVTVHRTSDTTTVTATLKSVNGEMFVPSEYGKLKFDELHMGRAIVLCSLDNRESGELLKFTGQLPSDLKTIVFPPIFNLKMETVYVNMDPLLCDYLQWECDFSIDILRTKKFSVPIGSETTQLLTNSDRSSKQTIMPMILWNSEKNFHESASGTSFVERKTNLHDQWLLIMKSLVLSITTDCWIVYIPTRRTRKPTKFARLAEIFNNVDEYTRLQVPAVHARSSLVRTVIQPHYFQTYPIELAPDVWRADKNSFPWSLKLTDFHVATLQNQSKKMFATCNATEVTLVVTERSKADTTTIKVKEDSAEASDDPLTKEASTAAAIAENDWTFCFHIDTTPVHLIFHQDQFPLIESGLFALQTLFTVRNKRVHAKQGVHGPLQSTSVGENDAELEKFLKLASSGSRDNADDESFVLKDCVDKTMRIPLWLQWTFTKLNLSIYTEHRGTPNKLVLDLEETIISLDKHHDYFKIKTKIGTAIGACYHRTADSKWTKNSLFGLNVKPDTNAEKVCNNMFMDCTITTARAESVYSKWGTLKKHNSMDKSLTEIMVKMQQVDIRLDIEFLLNIFGIFTRISTAREGTDELATNPVDCMPLIYFQWAGLRLFLPAVNEQSCCNVLIFKINLISISPMVENPLIRATVRPDIYTKASHLGILNVPGSDVEDRQYELALKDISICTGDWMEIQKALDSTIVENYSENPAFQWNNKASMSTVNTFSVCNNLTFVTTYAPSIFLKNKLVCGHSVEFNCVSDLSIELNVQQIGLIRTIVEPLLAYGVVRTESSASFEQPSTLNVNTSRGKIDSTDCDQRSTSKSHIFQTVIEDSGNFSINDSLLTTPKQQPPPTHCSETQEIPHEISVIAGMITLQLYNLQNDQQSDREPLLRLKIFQPNLFVARKMFETKVHASIYDVNIAFATTSRSAERSHFWSPLFETENGQVDKNGIQPPFVKVSWCRCLAERSIMATVARPARIAISPETLSRYFAICHIFLSNLDSDVPVEIVPEPCVKAEMTTFSRRLCRIANNINFNITTTTLVCSQHETNTMIIGFRSVTGECRISQKPESVQLSLNLSGLHSVVNEVTLLHPLTIHLTAKCTRESWHAKESHIVNATINCLMLDFGPKSCLSVQEMTAAFLGSINLNRTLLTNEYNRNLSKGASRNEAFHSRDKRLIQIVLPKIRESSAPVEEYYRDDLRAGAFQLIENSNETDLPLPYQIQVVHKENGMICWRYPQPRAMNKIQTFPFPINTNSVKVKCLLEYYAELHGSFQPYCEFLLSENETTCDIELPRRKVTASTWRATMKYTTVQIDSAFFEEEDSSNEEDTSATGSLNSKSLEESGISLQENKIILHPKILIACLRIDSIFSSKLLPKLQVLLDISLIRLNVLNQRHSSERIKVPKVLANYKYNAELNRNLHEVLLTLNCENVSGHGTLFSDKRLMFSVQGLINCELLDYSYLSVQPFINNLSFQLFGEHDGSLALSLVVNNMRVRYGPSFWHTLNVLAENWRYLHADTALCDQLNANTGRFVVCNGTATPLKFGQANTKELLSIGAREFTDYAFRTHKQDQALVFACAEFNWQQSRPVSIYRETLQYVPLDAGQMFIVETVKTSSTQKVVIVKGQIHMLNMSAESFRVQVKATAKASAVQETKMVGEFELAGKQELSLFAAYSPSSGHSVRLKLYGPDMKGWSGDVPLREGRKRAPWLVKVPCATETGHKSFWIQVIQEEIAVAETAATTTMTTGTVTSWSRVLIVIWPLFVIQSNLPIEIEAYSSELGQNFRLHGRGALQELSFAGTHEDPHDLLFSFRDQERTKVTLSYNSVNTEALFNTLKKEKLQVDTVLADLKSRSHLKWPCSRFENLKLDPHVSIAADAKPIFSFSKSQNGSCSLMLTIRSPCLFVNSTNQRVRLQRHPDQQTCLIAPDAMAIPFLIPEAFTIAVEENDLWFESDSLALPKPKKDKDGTILPYEGLCRVSIHCAGGIANFLLTTIYENESCVMVLAVEFVVCNQSSVNLNVRAFAVADGDKQDPMKSKLLNKDGHYDVATNKNGVTAPSHGTRITLFQHLTELNQRRSTEQALFFLTFSLETRHQSSFPLYVGKMFAKKSFSVQVATQSGTWIPLVATLVTHNGQQFLSVYDSLSPEIFIENHTNTQFYVAESDSAYLNKQSSAVRECPDGQFSWHQIIPANSGVFYTPPSLDFSFPDIISKELRIIFSVVTSDAIIKWSLPMQTNESRNFFLTIPIQGDVKMSINTSNQTKCIIIDYINQNVEFSASDIRSRLHQPELESPATMNEPYRYQQNHKSRGRNETRISTLAVLIKRFNLVLFNDVEVRNCLKTEIVSFNLFEIGVQCIEQQAKQMDLSVARLQIDNQLYSSGNFDFPVVFCAQDSSKRLVNTKTTVFLEHGVGSLLTEPLIQAQLVFYPGTRHVQSVQLRMEPTRVYIEGAFISVLFDFLFECLPQEVAVAERLTALDSAGVMRCGVVTVPSLVVDQSTDQLNTFALKWLKIEPVNLMLSVHTCMRMYIALDHSPLFFSAFERHNIKTTTLKLGYVLGMHYLSGALFGAGWLVGSLEILGSPSGLARSLSTGIKDFVSMPLHGFSRGPWGFFVGVTHGSISLVRNVTAGTVNSVTKLATSVARNLDRLTLDEEHLQRTDALRRYRPNGMAEGFTQGLSDFGISILGAVGGLSRHTIEAQSPVEVMAGVGKGLMGAFLKPISGAAELVALTGQGMLQSVGYNRLPHRKSVMPSIRNPALRVAGCKIQQKLMPDVCASAECLLLSDAMLVDGDSNGDGARHVTLALTRHALLIVDTDLDELSTIVAPLVNVVVEQNGANAKEFTISILEIATTTMPEEERVFSAINLRVEQFIRDTSNQLPIAAPPPVPEVQSAEVAVRKTIVISMPPKRGEYLIEYLYMLNKTE